MRFKPGDRVKYAGGEWLVDSIRHPPEGQSFYMLYHPPSSDLFSGVFDYALDPVEVKPLPDIPSVKKMALEVAALVEEKNAAYGNSHEKVADFFRLLYPNGIKPEQYGDSLTLARIFDKFMRIASGNEAFQQEDARKDIVGYALLLARR